MNSRCLAGNGGFTTWTSLRADVVASIQHLSPFEFSLKPICICLGVFFVLFLISCLFFGGFFHSFPVSEVVL